MTLGTSLAFLATPPVSLLLLAIAVGLLLCVAFQSLLASLGLAAGLSLARWPWPSGSKESSEESSEQTPEPGSQTASQLSIHQQSSMHQQPSAPTLAIASTGLCFSVAMSLFGACFCAGRFAGLQRPWVGITLGLVIWAGYLLLLLWLSIAAVESSFKFVFEFVLGNAVAGLRQLVQQARRLGSGSSPLPESVPDVADAAAVNQPQAEARPATDRAASVHSDRLRVKSPDDSLSKQLVMLLKESGILSEIAPDISVHFSSQELAEGLGKGLGKELSKGIGKELGLKPTGLKDLVRENLGPDTLGLDGLGLDKLRLDSLKPEDLVPETLGLENLDFETLKAQLKPHLGEVLEEAIAQLNLSQLNPSKLNPSKLRQYWRRFGPQRYNPSGDASAEADKAAPSREDPAQQTDRAPDEAETNQASPAPTPAEPAPDSEKESEKESEENAQAIQQLRRYFRYTSHRRLTPTGLTRKLETVLEPWTDEDSSPAPPTFPLDEFRELLQRRKGISSSKIRALLNQVRTEVEAIAPSPDPSHSQQRPDRWAQQVSKQVSKQVGQTKEQLEDRLDAAQTAIQTQVQKQVQKIETRAEQGAEAIKATAAEQAQQLQRGAAIAAWWLFVLTFSSGCAAAGAGYFSTRF